MSACFKLVKYVIFLLSHAGLLEMNIRFWGGIATAILWLGRIRVLNLHLSRYF